MDADHESGHHLQTSNEEIISLMESVGFKDNQILLKQGSAGEKAIAQVADFENKLAFVFDKLRSSQIYCIQRKDDDENHNRILYGTQFDGKLLFSQWLNFQYKQMLECIYTRGWGNRRPSCPPIAGKAARCYGAGPLPFLSGGIYLVLHD